MPDMQQPEHPHPGPLPSRERGPEETPRLMVSPLVPSVTVLDVAGMIGAVCDPNDPASCEMPEAFTSSAEDAR